MSLDESTSDVETDANGPIATDELESDAGDGPADESLDRAELAAQVELLAEENGRLRTEYARARQSRYRNTALGFAAIGLLAALGGVVFPDGQEVLFVLGATGLFGGVLTYYLTPGRFVAAEVGERVYATTAANEAALVGELGLRDDRLYVPAADDSPSSAGSVRLYVPQHAAFELPEIRRHTGPIVTDEDERGLVLEPTGEGLFGAFERAVTGELAGAPGPLATQLADGLVEQFELARSAHPDVDREHGRVTVAITDSAFGDVDRFDHPIASFLAVGFAAGLDRPIELDVVPADDRADWLVTCRWALESSFESASESPSASPSSPSESAFADGRENERTEPDGEVENPP